MQEFLAEHVSELLWGGTVAVFGTSVKLLWARIKAVNDGMCCILRQQLIDQYDRWTERGYCPVWAKDVWTKAFKAYHALGGNSVVDEMNGVLMELPIEPPV